MNQKGLPHIQSIVKNDRPNETLNIRNSNSK